MAARFAAELTFKPAYYKFRIIGVEDGGREIVRGRPVGPGRRGAHCPRTRELQRRATAPISGEAIAQPAGTVLMSSLDLSRENGEVATPNVPVLRVATPIMAPDGSVFGIVVITSTCGRRSTASARSRPPAPAYLCRQRPRRLSGASRSSPRIRVRIRPPRTASRTSFRRWRPSLSGLDGAASLIDGASRTARRRCRAGGMEQWSVARRGRDRTLFGDHERLAGGAAGHRAGDRAGGRRGAVHAVLLSRSLARPLGRDHRGRRSFGRGEPARPPVDAGGEIGDAGALVRSDGQQRSATRPPPSRKR